VVLDWTWPVGHQLLLCMKTYTCSCIHLQHDSLNTYWWKNVSNKTYREKRTHILCPIHFFCNVKFFELIKQKGFWRLEPSGVLRRAGAVYTDISEVQHAPLKRRSTPRLHGATSQKALIFILTSVRTWISQKGVLCCVILEIKNQWFDSDQTLCWKPLFIHPTYFMRFIRQSKVNTY
jgi:hypothetical protein